MLSEQIISGAWLTLNRACNNRCKWCYARGTNFQDNVLSLELAEKLIKLLTELGVKKAVLIGGEPTIYPDLITLIDLLKKANIQPIIVTNGRRFADRNFCKKIINAGVKKVTISPKAANRQQYIELTGFDGYDEMVKGAKNLQQEAINPSFLITIVKPLIGKMSELIKNLINEGINNFTFSLGNPIIIGDAISTEYIANPSELTKGCIEAYLAVKKHRVNYSFLVTTPLCLFPKDIKDELIQQNHINTSCVLHKKNGVIFNQNGEVLPCNSFISHPIGKYGVDFISAEEFIRFWQGKSLQLLRSSYQKYPSKKCITCEDWDICGGGCCIVKWLYWKPDDYIGKEVII